MAAKTWMGVILSLGCAMAAWGADRLETRRVLDEFDSVRPRAADLAFYQLDWAPTLKAAKEQAAREKRPILLIVVTNSFGDVCSGHC